MSTRVCRLLFALVFLFAAPAVLAQVDMRINSMTGSPDPMTLGTGDITYSISVDNLTAAPATDVALSVPLPAPATFVSATAPGATCGESGGTVTCTWPTFNASATVTAQVVFTPTAGGTLSATATVTATEADPDMANNSASVSTTVNAVIDLSVTSFTDTPDPITLGSGNVTYSLSIFNGSSSKATNASVAMTTSPSSTFVSATPSAGGTCGEAAGTVSCNWPEVLAGGSHNASIVLTPTAAGQMTATATVSGGETGDDRSRVRIDVRRRRLRVVGGVRIRLVPVTHDPTFIPAQ